MIHHISDSRVVSSLRRSPRGRWWDGRISWQGLDMQGDMPTYRLTRIVHSFGPKRPLVCGRCDWTLEQLCRREVAWRFGALVHRTVVRLYGSFVAFLANHPCSQQITIVVGEMQASRSKQHVAVFADAAAVTRELGSCIRPHSRTRSYEWQWQEG